MEWQDREIDRLLGLLKQHKLPADIKSTARISFDNWLMTE